MKRFVFTLLASFGLFLLAIAQPDNGRNGRGDRGEADFAQLSEKLQNERIAFYTNLIGLTPDEAQKFWPLHNEFNRKKGELYEEQRKLKDQFSNDSKMSEKEAEALMSQYATTIKKDAELSLFYHQQFMKVLSPVKVMKIYIAEDQFKSSLLRRIREPRTQDQQEGQGRQNQQNQQNQQGFPWAPWQGNNLNNQQR